MNHIKTTALRVKNHVSSHKGTYAVGVVAIAAIALQQSNRRDFYAFLTTKGIDPMEFYCPEMFEEITS